MEEEQKNSFITIPRFIASDYRNGKISRNERQMLEWIRQLTNPYGIAFVDLQSLTADCFDRGVSVNYANKTLLSLKKKRYLHSLRS